MIEHRFGGLAVWLLSGAPHKRLISGTFICLTVALLTATLAHGASFYRARESYAGTASGQFLKLGIGNAEAMALGRSYVAIADGIKSLGYNPAGIARSNSNELALGMTKWAGDISGNYIGFNHPLMHANVAFNAAYFTISDFDVRDENGIPLAGADVFVRAGFVNAGFGWSLPAERVFLGFGAKSVMESFYTHSSNNFAVDGGILWLAGSRLQFGASLLNLSLDTVKVPWSLRAGLAYQFPAFLGVSADIIQDADSKTRVGSGLIIKLPEVEEIGMLSLRVGYYSADDQGESSLGLLKKFQLHRNSGLSYGLGVDTRSDTLYHMSLDYALVPLGVLGTSHHVNMRFQF